MTLDTISIQLKHIANEIGGGHLTNEEAEKKIKEKAHKLDLINKNIGMRLKEYREEINTVYLGIDDEYLDMVRRIEGTNK